MDHSIQIEHSASDWECFIEKFSSNRFSMFYQSNPFPSSVQTSALQMTEEYFNFVNSIEEVVSIVKNQGGWDVIGWYKRGLIDDKSITQSDFVNKKK